jgi:hypothetical protein
MDKRGAFGVSLLSAAGFRSPPVYGDGDLPLPKPFRGAILALKPPGIWRMSDKNLFGGRARFKPPQEPQPRVMRRAYEPGEVLCDGYVVRLLLGQGGMGGVYLVEHSGSGDLRAAKVMRVRSSATDADLVGFRQEALSLLNVAPILSLSGSSTCGSKRETPCW